MFAYWDKAKYHTLTFINYSNAQKRIEIDTVYENEIFLPHSVSSNTTDSFFEDWYSHPTQGNVPFQFKNALTKNDTVYARFFKPQSFILTFEPNHGVMPTYPQPFYFTGGLRIAQQLPTPYFAGKEFVGWFFDNNTFKEKIDASTLLYASVTAYAKWIEVVASEPSALSYAPANVSSILGTPDSSIAPTINVGITAVTYSISGNPSGVSINASTGKILWTNAVALGTYNMTITATNSVGFTTTNYTLTISPIVYTVTFEGGSPAPITNIAQLTAVEAVEPTKADSAFVAWFRDAARTTQVAFPLTLTANTTLYPKFISTTYTVTFEGGSPAPIANLVQLTAVEAVEPTKADSTFVAWFRDVARTTQVAFPLTLTANTTLYPKFISTTYTVTFEGGSPTPITSITQLTNAQAGSPTKADSTFVAWFMDAARTTQVTFPLMLTANTMLYPKFTPAGACTEANNRVNLNGVCYKTVVIGTQTWLAENLNDASNTAGGSSCYNNSPDSCTKYGRLYDWYAAMDIDSKIAGWHFPSDAEWETLSDYLGGEEVAGGKMKVGGGSGFDALFVGNQTSEGNSYNMGSNAMFWSSTSDGPTASVGVNRINTSLDYFTNDRSRRLSVRLIKDVAVSSYTVSFDLNYSGSTGAPASQTITSGLNVSTPTAPTRDGYIFNGWFVATTGGDAITTLGPITANTQYYAQWTPVPCTEDYNRVLLNDVCYKTVVIETQTWLAENLNDASNTAGGSSCYNNSPDSCAKYGRLYDWDAAKSMDTAIEGWHLPGDAEWTTFGDHLGGEDVAGGKMKVGGGSGFDALFAGFHSGGVFFGMGARAYFWSSAPDRSGSAWHRHLNSGSSNLASSNEYTDGRLSVRLVKD